MRRLALLPVAIIAVLTAAAAPLGAERLAGSAHGGRGFTLPLSGATEVPGPGDPDGTGTASLTFNVGHGELCYELTVANLDAVVAAHLHEELPGEEFGGVLVGLDPPVDGSSSGCVTLPREQVREILGDRDEYYVNVHTETFPNGAVRGNLG